jgi:putative ATP-dependent endonuclease of OLD family
LADYLIKELSGQTLITSHSPQIAARYKPDSITNLISKNNYAIFINVGTVDATIV